MWMTTSATSSVVDTGKVRQGWIQRAAMLESPETRTRYHSSVSWIMTREHLRGTLKGNADGIGSGWCWRLFHQRKAKLQQMWSAHPAWELCLWRWQMTGKASSAFPTLWLEAPRNYHESHCSDPSSLHLNKLGPRDIGCRSTAGEKKATDLLSPSAEPGRKLLSPDKSTI